jgi:hypothetical protein
MSSKVCLVALLGMVGCTSNLSQTTQPGLQYQVVIDNTFTVSQIADLEAGYHMWQLAVPTLRLSVLVSDTCLSAPHVVCVGNNAETSATLLGYTVRDAQQDSALTTIYPALQQFNHVELQTTAAHELGHAMGLIHTQDWRDSVDNSTTPTLMYWNYLGQAHQITSTDLQQFWSLR